MGYRTSIEKAALKTLEQLGYTWHESELWKPPIGKSASPLLDKIDLLEARIAALTKDAERLKCFNQIWRWKALKDGEIIYQYGEHVPSLFQKTAELLPTHQPAPKAITADMVTDEMVKTSVFVNVFNAKQQIANVVNAFNGVKP